jgi:hypothetical protein
MAPHTLSFLLCSLLALLSHSLALETTEGKEVVAVTNPDNTVTYLSDDRRPALYTRDFGDCLGSSLVKVHRFDASYYKDNMTVTFDIQGTTNLTKEAVMSNKHGHFTNRNYTDSI